MKNRSIVKLICAIWMMGLLSSCMGLADTAPTVTLMPEIQSFNVNSENGYDFELTATLAKEDAAKIVECGFYVSDHKSMQGAEKIVSKLFGQEFIIAKTKSTFRQNEMRRIDTKTKCASFDALFFLYNTIKALISQGSF